MYSTPQGVWSLGSNLLALFIALPFTVGSSGKICRTFTGSMPTPKSLANLTCQSFKSAVKPWENSCRALKAFFQNWLPVFTKYLFPSTALAEEGRVKNRAKNPKRQSFFTLFICFFNVTLF